MISLDKPWNDVADQLRPAWTDLDATGEIETGVPGSDETAALAEVGEADPADVADQRQVVPLPYDRQWP